MLPESFDVTLLRVVEESPDTATLVLDAQGHKAYRAGQYLSIAPQQFAELAQQWISLGKPASFSPTAGDAGAPDSGSGAQFTMTPEIGDALTNIGNCIPDAALVAQASQQALAQAR